MTAPYQPRTPRLALRMLREVTEVDAAGRLVARRAIVGIDAVGQVPSRPRWNGGLVDDFSCFFG